MAYWRCMELRHFCSPCLLPTWAHIHTHTEIHTYTDAKPQPVTHTPLGCVSLTQQTSRSYLVCLPVCLPTVFSLLLLCLGLCLMWTADCSKWPTKWQMQLGGWWVKMKMVTPSDKVWSWSGWINSNVSVFVFKTWQLNGSLHIQLQRDTGKYSKLT